MSPKQTSLYWREWAAVRRVNPAADRHELHARALGEDKSSKEFTNADLDRVLAEFRAVSQPDNLNAQVRLAQQPEIRFEHKIREQTELLGVLGIIDPEGYVRCILRDKFGTSDISDLSAEKHPRWNNFKRCMVEDSQQDMLRNTLAARISNERQRKGWTVKELYARLACSRLIAEIRDLAPEAYWTAVSEQRFGPCDLNLLTEAQLKQLRNVIAMESNRVRRTPTQPEGRELASAIADSDCNEPF